MSKDDALRAARYYLESQGIEIIEEGYEGKAGAVDLIYREGDELVFAVADSSDGLVMPDDTLGAGDRVRMEIAAAEYLSSHDVPSSRIRFDTFKIARVDKDKSLLCHHRDAFGAARESGINRTGEAERILGDKSGKPAKAKPSRVHEHQGR
jgi:Holliday junction resolvase-like predicted endonuclease